MSKGFYIGCRHSALILAAVAVVLLPKQTCLGALRTWTGNTSGYWADAGNWSGGVPQSGDDLNFPSGLYATRTTNDLGLGLTFGEITISQSKLLSAYHIDGYNIVLTNGINVSGNSFYAMNVACPIMLGGNHTAGIEETFSATRPLAITGYLDINGHHLLVDTSSTVTLSGTVVDHYAPMDGYLMKTNSGVLYFPPGTVLGPQVIGLQGTIRVDAVTTNAFSLDGAAGPVSLEGTGSVGTIQLANGATLSPGDGGPGIFRCLSADLGSSFGPPGGNLLVQLKGTTPGVDYSQFVCSNSCFFGLPGYLPSLTIQLDYDPQVGDSYRIIERGTNSDSPGYFVGLNNYAMIEFTNRCSLGIEYDSTGVTLTTLRRPDSPFALWKGRDYPPAPWSHAANWAGGIVPTNGSRLEFTSYGYARKATNDFDTATSMLSLLFTTNGYTISGRDLTLTEGITNGVNSGTNVCTLNLVVSNQLVLDTDPGGTLEINHHFKGTGTIEKQGGGELHYTSATAGSFAGSVIVDDGTFRADGNFSFVDAPITVNDGLLCGTGIVTSITLNGGTLNPGDNPGILHVEGDLTMAPGASLQAHLNGSDPGSGYDQLSVLGAVDLNGATLDLRPGFAVTAGTSFILIVNSGTDPVLGTFAGLPEGAVFQADGQYFSVTYQGGLNGNDVVVTRESSSYGTLTRIIPLDADVVQLQGTGVPDLDYLIQANTNLTMTNWLDIGTAPADSSGHFFFNESNVLSYPERFFRAVPP